MNTSRNLLAVLLLTASLAPSPARAGTLITVTTNVMVPGVKRFGIDIGNINYYDSGQVMKELVFRNPGFEGMLFQSIVQVGSGTPANAVENGALLAWPSGFWSGASYEFIYGAANGRTGAVVTSINPLAPGGNTNGTTYVFAETGISPASGDYMILRKNWLGDGGAGGGAASSGWWTNFSGGGTITSETNDLAPDTLGAQCIRLSASNSGQSASISAFFDTWRGVSFIQLNGDYRLAFKAKGVAGANSLLVQLRRASGPFWINQTLILSNSWQDYTLNFHAAETGSATGSVALVFAPVNRSALLLDDVSLRQTDSDPANTTSFRDAVFNALRDYSPGILRKPNWQQLGNSLDNELAAPFARQRSGYSSYSTLQGDLLVSLPEWLDLCEAISAEPWYPMPTVFSPREMANLMEYLGGDINTPYGAVRAARGHPAPWTSVFSKIHLEVGNENWNSGYRGGSIADPVVYGIRGDELFQSVKNSPYYNAAQFDLVLGGQAAGPWLDNQIHLHSTNLDSIALAPYMASMIDSLSTTEQLYGSLFAEPEWWNLNGGLIAQTYSNVTKGPHPAAVSIYEVNINVPKGAIDGSQAALDSYTPSLGAGLAVADNMLMMLRESKVRDQGLFALPGYEFQTPSNTWAFVWGVARDMGVTDRKRPQYLAVQLANQVLAGNLLTTIHTGDDPTWSVTNVNRITYTNAHYLQSYAFATSTNRALVIFNLHRTSPLVVNFSGPNAPAGSVTLKRLTSANITDNNENSNVVSTTTQALDQFDPAQDFTLPPFSMNVLQWPVNGPALSIAQSGSNVTISWPATAIDCVLEVTSNLTSGTWMRVTNPVTSGNGQSQVILSPTATGTRFYRRRSP